MFLLRNSLHQTLDPIFRKTHQLHNHNYFILELWHSYEVQPALFTKIEIDAFFRKHTVVILCSDGMKHLFWLCLGKVAQNILSVRNCSPNWQQFPQQRTFFLVNFQQDTQFRKSWGHPFLNLKSTLVLVNDCKKL